MNVDEKVKRVIDAAKKFCSGGDMVEGFTFTKEDEDDYLDLRIAVDNLAKGE